MDDPIDARRPTRRPQPGELTRAQRARRARWSIGVAIACFGPAAIWATLAEGSKFLGWDGLGAAALMVVVGVWVPLNRPRKRVDRRLTALLLTPACLLWATSIVVGNLRPTTEVVAVSQAYVGKGKGGGPKIVDVYGRIYDVPRRVLQQVRPGRVFVCTGNDLPVFGPHFHEFRPYEPAPG